jgi:Tannase and feruloyl esterase
VLYKNPNWDWRKMNLTTDVAAIEKSYRNLIDATNPDMKPFFTHKGNLLLYHGWSDQAIAPGNTVNYYKSVVKDLGGETKASNDVRLFMVPAMAHCDGGEGPNNFDKMTAIQDWVEHGEAPETMITSRISRSGAVERTRPLCLYPKVAKYEGSGSIDDAANFTCALP